MVSLSSVSSKTVTDSILNLLFLCRHLQLTRPITPTAVRESDGQSYVVCLDCGKHLAYDVRQMKMGRVIRLRAANQGRGFHEASF